MNILPKKPALHIINSSGSKVRLRFYSAEYIIWDTWITPDGSLFVPAPNTAAINVSASFIDTKDYVTYHVQKRVTGHRARITAKKTEHSGAQVFTLSQETSTANCDLEMNNMTADDIRFDLRFLQSPFTVTHLVKAQAVCQINLFPVSMVAVVNSITTPPVHIKDWDSTVEIKTETELNRERPLITRCKPIRRT